MATKIAGLALLIFLHSALATAQPEARQVDDKKLVERVYNLKSLLGNHGRAIDFTDADAVIKFILQNVAIGEAKPGADGPQILERDGGKLEVRATAKVQGEIRELLAALERIQDVAVDVKADLIELDAASFAKLQKTLLPNNTKPPVLLAIGEETDDEKKLAAMGKTLKEANKILEAGRVVQTSTARFVNGAEATISARRVVVPYANHGEPVGVARANPHFTKEGFALVAVPVVSFDRRFIRFKLTEHSTTITGMKKRELFEIDGKPVIAQTPVVDDLGSTGSAVVADNGTMLFRLAYAPKDKVWVVLVKPTIFIRAEEEEFDHQRLKRWFDLFFGR